MNLLEQKLRKSRIALLLRQPFFGTIASALSIDISANPTQASTDGERLWLDPQWLDAVDPRELNAVVGELTLHVVLKHHLRRGCRDPKRWNVAADQAVFHAMRAALMPLRHGAYVVPEAHGLSAEVIYERLTKASASPQATPGKPPSAGERNKPY